MQDLTQLFPVTLNTDWQTLPVSSLSNELKSWLYDPNSLTARLKKQCQNFSVVVLGQAQTRCDENEACEHISAGEPIVVREVLLYCDDVPQVFARSIMPLATLTGDESFLSELGDRPLGQAIFNSAGLARGDFSVAQFYRTSRVAQLARQLSLPLQEPLWGRRSIFFLHGKPLAVAEVFLPDSAAYQVSKVEV